MQAVIGLVATSCASGGGGSSGGGGEGQRLRSRRGLRQCRPAPWIPWRAPKLREGAILTLGRRGQGPQGPLARLQALSAISDAPKQTDMPGGAPAGSPTRGPAC